MMGSLPPLQGINLLAKQMSRVLTQKCRWFEWLPVFMCQHFDWHVVCPECTLALTPCHLGSAWWVNRWMKLEVYQRQAALPLRWQQIDNFEEYPLCCDGKITKSNWFHVLTKLRNRRQFAYRSTLSRSKKKQLTLQIPLVRVFCPVWLSGFNILQFSLV